MVVFLDRFFGRKNKIDEPPGKGGVTYAKDLLQGDLFEIGEFTYGCPHVIQWDDSTYLHIGRFCSIADEVTIMLGGNHRTDWVTTYPFNVLSEHFPKASNLKGHPATKGDVWIGNDVWIGRGVTVLSGVHIGDGAVIGANAVVSKDVEPYAVVVGNPGKMVKKRFDDATIKSLLEIRWWDWDVNRINESSPLLCSSNIQEFIDRYGK